MTTYILCTDICTVYTVDEGVEKKNGSSTEKRESMMKALL
jgi:hypothetical protein